MALDSQIKDSLNQTINVASVSSINSGQVPTYGAAASRSARVEVKRGLVEAADGSAVATTHRLLLDHADGTPLLTDRIWLPGDSTSDVALARHPQGIEQGIDEDGTTTHWVVLV